LGPPWKEVRREAVGPVEGSKQLVYSIPEIDALSPSWWLYYKRSIIGTTRNGLLNTAIRLHSFCPRNVLKLFILDQDKFL
jgi:hypothetical protein